jgi:DNA-directed RNA polymerase subunit alpha
MLVIQRPSVEAIGDDHPTRQRFAVGPLEPGFGHTIGNSLRRTLLSSIPGAAITTVKFDGVEHEFTVIKGMTEDITEFIMNLKDVVVVSRSDEPVVVRIDVKGPMVLTAANIPTTSDIDILNPSLHLATLNAGAQLALDITFERGRGYLSTDRDAESRIIGVIPIDSIFSPVRRVMFEVEPTRVAQSTNYDRLVLDIETDGSISPRESLASASATLRSLVDLIATLSEEPQSLELSEPMGANVGVPDLDLPIEDLDLSERPRNCLKRGQINTIGELLLKSTDDLLNITNFGQKSLDEIIQKLDERGLTLRA